MGKVGAGLQRGKFPLSTLSIFEHVKHASVTRPNLLIENLSWSTSRLAILLNKNGNVWVASRTIRAHETLAQSLVNILQNEKCAFEASP